jgi:hypothetical protein
MLSMTEAPFGQIPRRLVSALERRAEQPTQTAEERHRAVLAGQIIAVQEGVIKDLEPFDTVYTTTTALLTGVHPASIDYAPKLSKDDLPSKSLERQVAATSTYHCPNLLLPDAKEMITVDFHVDTTVQGDLSRQGEENELMYALWYLKEYRPFFDRAFRHTLFQPKKLMDTNVRRGKTDDLEQSVADALLKSSSDIRFQVARTHAEPGEPPLYFGRVRSLKAKVNDSNTYLQTDDPLRVTEVVRKRRYNQQTGKMEGPTPADVDAYLRDTQLDARNLKTHEWLQEVNDALMHAGYTTAT